VAADEIPATEKDQFLLETKSRLPAQTLEIDPNQGPTSLAQILRTARNSENVCLPSACSTDEIETGSTDAGPHGLVEGALSARLRSTNQAWIGAVQNA